VADTRCRWNIGGIDPANDYDAAALLYYWPAGTTMLLLCSATGLRGLQGCCSAVLLACGYYNAAAMHYMEEKASPENLRVRHDPREDVPRSPCSSPGGCPAIELRMDKFNVTSGTVM
jgi:hypothetical protein